MGSLLLIFDIHKIKKSIIITNVYSTALERERKIECPSFQTLTLPHGRIRSSVQSSTG